MISIIGVNLRYGNLELICDNEFFAHFRSLILNEIQGDPPDAAEIKRIVIHEPVDEPPARASWRGVALTILFGSIPSAIVYVVGWITVVRWIFRFF